jgi:hypothetical protein
MPPIQNGRHFELCEQGDQIGRIFAAWEFVFHGLFLKITVPKFQKHFSEQKVMY